MGKLGLIALVIGGIITMIARFFITQIAKSSSLVTIKKIKRDPAYANQVATELDIPISTRKDFGATDFQLLKKYLAEQSVVGNYQILYIAELNSTEFIIFTKISFVDFGVGISGKGGDVNKTEYLTFLTAYDTESRSLTVRSEVYYNANDKILKEGFLKAVFESTAVIQS
jgi:hypothetical protein